MELRSKKLSKELKDLDRINDADLDTSEIAQQHDLSGAEAGQYEHQSAHRRTHDNN